MPGLFALLLAAAALLPARPTLAAGDPCATLGAEQKAAAERVMAKVYPHDCCDDTLKACLAAEKPSRLVRRLAASVCRRVAAGQKEADIQRALERRGASMVAVGPAPKMDLSDAVFAGDPSAPVEVVAYACARCPFCSKVVPALHECVTDGRLKGKARLTVRVFPIRSHTGSTEGGLAFVAALRAGKFWPYLLRVYQQFDAFAVASLPKWAAEVGIDPAEYDRLVKDPKTRDLLVASKREGLRNKVAATPTFFLNGKFYRGDLDPEALWDAIEEEAERVQGSLCQP